MDVEYISMLVNDKGLKPTLLNEEFLRLEFTQIRHLVNSYDLSSRGHPFLIVEGEPNIEDLIDIISISSNLTYYTNQQKSDRERISNTILELKPNTNVYDRFKGLTVYTDDYEVFFYQELGDTNNWKILDYIIHKLL